jgi:predicted RNA binding protein YcfA (HicA-like mRNA interferase family)
MPKLPVVTAKALLKVLEQVGFVHVLVLVATVS